MQATNTQSEKATGSQNADDQNDAIRAQVDAELPRPVGGFETDEEEAAWKEAQEERFIELCGIAGLNEEIPMAGRQAAEVIAEELSR